MSGEDLPDIGENCENVFSEVLPQPPTLFTGKALWNGMSLEHHNLPPGETPEYTLEQFVITINLFCYFGESKIREYTQLAIIKGTGEARK